jgi:hypothetical protein
MNRSFMVGVIALVWCAGALGLRAEKHALLVGVSQYPNLPAESWLKGPEQDVAMMRELLLTPACGFKTNHIVALCGWPKDALRRPTYKNIKAAVASMTGEVQRGDFVFLLFSGHGSQQPVHPDAKDIENDGLDEIFLPADVSDWDNAKQSVKHAITDNEVRTWVEELLGKGASVWIVFDSCHSGTMTREFATADRQYRRVAPEMLIPEAVLRKAAKRTGVTRAIGGAGSPHDLPVDRPGLVAMYAAQSFEPTFEIPLPNPEDERHGIFTYMLAKVIGAAEQPMTYRELTNRIMTLYRCNGILQPTPGIEGTAVDALVLESKALGDRPTIRMFRDPRLQRLRIDRGSLHGIGCKSLLEVFPPAGVADAEKRLGYVKVSRVSALTAEVLPVAHNGLPRPETTALGLGNRCRIASLAFDLPPLRVAVRDVSGAPLLRFRGKATTRPNMQSVVRAVATANPNLVTNVSAGKAEWILAAEGNAILLESITQTVVEPTDASAPSRLLVADLSQVEARSAEALQRATQSALLRLARARQLLHLASAGSPGDSRSGVQVGVELLRYESETAARGTPIINGPAGRILHDGDIVSFRITNPNTFPIDVSLLFIDSQYGITCLFPERGTVDDNRLLPGQVIEIPRIAVNATTVGPEQVVTIAVRSTLDRQDFRCLEQESLGQRRSGENQAASPLQQLLETTIYGKGATRGLDRGALSAHRITALTWTTAPGEAGGQPERAD